MIKGSLLSGVPIVSDFQSVFFAKNRRFGALKRGQMSPLIFVTPKGTSLRDFASFESSRAKSVEGSDLWVVLRKNVYVRLYQKII